MTNQYDVCIIGGGAAGMSAALGAIENGAKKVILLETDVELGGILQQCIHNGFGLHLFNEELTGPAFAERLRSQLEQTSVEIKLQTTVVKITEDRFVHYINEKDGYQAIQANAIVISTGSRERTRYQIDIPGKRLAGIMTAGVAQRYLNIDGYLVGQKVFILGSGDIGLIMARRMTLEGANVLGVAEIMPYSNGLNRNVVQCLDDFNIPLYLNHTVTNVEGEDRLKAITISEVDEKMQVVEGTEKTFKVDTLLLSVGLIPENQLLKEINVKMNSSTKGVSVDQHYQTSVKGVFACGNALHVHDLVDFVSEESYEAGKNAALFSADEKAATKQVIQVMPDTNVRYIIPNQIDMTKSIDVLSFKFRVSQPFVKGMIIVKNGDKVLKEIKKMHLLPAEMESIQIKTADLDINEAAAITIEVKGVD